MASVPSQFPRYTLQDYLSWKGDWGLWDGVPIAKSPSPFGLHQVVVAKMVTQLNNALVAVGCDCVAVAELDWIVRQDTVVRPDVMVICGDPPEGHQLSPPAMIVEVLSTSTRGNDLCYKKDLYYDQGVKYYWVADLMAQTVAAFDMTSPDGESTPLGGITRFTLGDDCQIEIDPAEIWPNRRH